MTTFADLEIRSVTHRFGSTTALSEVNATVRGGTITGLVGRNGAGKTTLARLVAAWQPLQSGSIELGGHPVWENPDRTSRVCLMKDTGGFQDDQPIRRSLRVHRAARPRWDQDYAMRLLDLFEVPTKKSPDKLSTGKRSALRAAVALASRAEVTILDEVYLGMDAVARRLFYDELMADYIAHPRTFILSSHLLDEVEDLMEEVIVLDRGRVVASGDTDGVRQQHSSGSSLASLTDVLVQISTAGAQR
ncbi:MAG: ABC transporter ATP-binding protein [Ornithinimicrobium sp.]